MAKRTPSTAAEAVGENSKMTSVKRQQLVTPAEVAREIAIPVAPSRRSDKSCGC